jgi:hypothetical protein
MFMKKLSFSDPNLDWFFNQYVMTRGTYLDGIKILANKPKWITEIIQSCTCENQRIADFSSAFLMHVSWSAPTLLEEYTVTMINILSETNYHGTKRNLFSTIVELPLVEVQTTRMFDFCLLTVSDPTQKIVAIIKAMRYLEKICQIYPELVPEVLLVISNYKQKPSKGIANRFNCFIRDFASKKQI